MPYGSGAFLAKVNASGTGLVYLTLLGSKNYDFGAYSIPANLISAVALDASGSAYIIGRTSDPNFPATTGAFQTALAGDASNQFDPPSDAFVAKLNLSGSAVIWATFLGGASDDGAQTVALDPSDNVWVSGTTNSADFPSPFGWPRGGEFLAEFNPGGNRLLYAAQFPAGSVAAALAIDVAGAIHAAGVAGMVSSFTADSVPGQTAAANILGVENAAGGLLAGRVVPGELISIFGLNLGPVSPVTAAVNSAGFLPTLLGGVQITINGWVAPLLYVSSTQINAVAPIELADGAMGTLHFVTDKVAAPDLRIVVDSGAPQVFRSADQSAAALNQDGTVNSSTNPAKAGSYVSIWATGTGAISGVDGRIASGVARSFCLCSITADGAFVNVTYAGAAPGLVNGAVQINFQIPSSGASSFVLNAGGESSDVFSIFVAQH